jgi:hypothetical protein
VIGAEALAVLICSMLMFFVFFLFLVLFPQEERGEGVEKRTFIGCWSTWTSMHRLICANLLLLEEGTILDDSHPIVLQALGAMRRYSRLDDNES